MSDMRSQTQSPMQRRDGALPAEEDVDAFRRGVQFGREVAGTAVRKIGAWSEEHPGQMALAALALGFLLGKLLGGRPRPISEELE